MMEYLQNIININVYRDQQNGYGHPLELFLPEKLRKEEKLHGENPPSGKEKAQYEQHVFIMSISSLE